MPPQPISRAKGQQKPEVSAFKHMHPLDPFRAVSNRIYQASFGLPGVLRTCIITYPEQPYFSRNFNLVIILYNLGGTFSQQLFKTLNKFLILTAITIHGFSLYRLFVCISGLFYVPITIFMYKALLLKLAPKTVIKAVTVRIRTIRATTPVTVI